MRGGVNALRLHKASGDEVTILLSERPLVTFNNNDLVITTHMDEVSYPSADVLKLTYVNVNPTNINGIERSGTLYSLIGDELKIANAVPGSRVFVYTVDGTLLTSSTTDTQGCSTLPIAGMSGSVYVVKTSSVTFKIRKL